MIIVIGGSGFIGTRFCTGLQAAGRDFRIIDLRPSATFADRTILADITDHAALSRAMEGVPAHATVVHLAALHRDDVRDPAHYYRTNVDGTANVCAVADAQGIERIVFTSTVAVFGFADPATPETGPIQPFNDYGRSKAEAETVLQAWHRTRPDTRSLSILRPTVVFGEGNRGNVYNLLHQIASGRFVMIGDGRNRKSLAYVGNVAAFLDWCCQRGSGSAVYNYVDTPDFDMNTLVAHVRQTLLGRRGVGLRLPRGPGLAIGRLADLVARTTGRRLPISRIRVQKFCAETSFASTAHDQPGFTAPFPLQEGLRRTLVSEFLSPDPDRLIFHSE